MSEQLALKTIAELASLLQKKEVSPVDITKSVFDRIKKYDKEINAYIDVTEELALETANTAEKEIMKGNYRGALHGIPIALKDIFCFKDEKVTFGSKIHKDFVADYDATVIRKLKDAGTIFTGKLNMHEYAYGGTTTNPHFGTCRNPWNLEKIPGGSSGGSAAAVSADLTIASLGTDTGGSIRMPASVCGIVGFKPTHGLVSKYGCFPLSWSLDHIGPMTKTVEDAAILLELIAGFDEKDQTSVKVPRKNYSETLTGNIKGKIIGIEEDYFFHHIDRGVEKLVREGIQQLEKLGAKVKVIRIPSLKYAEFAELMTYFGESATIHKENFQVRPHDYGEDVQSKLKLANLVSAVDYLQAQQIRRRMAADFSYVFEKVDVVISPVLPGLVPSIGEDSISINGEMKPIGNHLFRLNAPGNLVGLPAISIPCGFSQGLPVGMQIIGPAFMEETVLNFAYAYEKTSSVAGVKPVQFL